MSIKKRPYDIVREMQGKNLGKTLLPFLFSTLASATAGGGAGGGGGLGAIGSVPCTIIRSVFQALQTILGTLAMIMFIYGGLKYIFSADDPGGRKQGKMIAINATIGGMIYLIWLSVETLLAASTGGVLDWSSCLT